MTDWHHTSGVTGDMMIRDTGTVVEFWFRAGYNNDHWDPLQFNVTANGSTSATINIDYNVNRPWVRVTTRTITTDQTVTFRLLTATGTQGMGGPTTFSHTIDRTSRPGKPSSVRISNVTFQTLTATFTNGASNGGTIDQRAIAYNTVNTITGSTILAIGTNLNLTNLKPGQVYYFWARNHNSAGYSDWSAVSSATMWAGVYVKVGAVWKMAIPYVRVGGVWKQARPWVRRLGIWKTTVK